MGGQFKICVGSDNRNIQHPCILRFRPSGLSAFLYRSGAPIRLLAMLAWMDLEMTGLDPSQHVIVEIATLVTDDDLNIIAEGPDLVIHQPEEVLAETTKAWRSVFHHERPATEQGFEETFGALSTPNFPLMNVKKWKASDVSYTVGKMKTQVARGADH